MNAVFSVIKNERPFIREWVDHHLDIGFDRIYLLEDNGSESHADLMTDLISDGRVVLQRYEDCDIKAAFGGRQLEAFNRFIAGHRDSEISWCAFLDADEFIVLDGITLPEFTERFEPYASVVLYWKVFNASGHVKRPDLPVREAYTQIVPWNREAYDFKCIINLKRTEPPYMTNVHLGVKIVNTNFKPVSGKATPVYDLMYINHYFTKSWEDFVDRMKIGAFAFNNRDCDDFFRLNPDMEQDHLSLLKSIEHEKFPSLNRLSKRYEFYLCGNMKVLGELNRRPRSNFDWV